MEQLSLVSSQTSSDRAVVVLLATQAGTAKLDPLSAHKQVHHTQVVVVECTGDIHWQALESLAGGTPSSSCLKAAAANVVSLDVPTSSGLSSCVGSSMGLAATISFSGVGTSRDTTLGLPPLSDMATMECRSQSYLQKL